MTLNGGSGRQAECAALGHPGVTFNPWMDRTWCLCGQRTYEGDVVSVPHVACCGGLLDRFGSADST